MQLGSMVGYRGRGDGARLAGGADEHDSGRPRSAQLRAIAELSG